MWAALRNARPWRAGRVLGGPGLGRPIDDGIKSRAGRHAASVIPPSYCFIEDKSCVAVPRACPLTASLPQREHAHLSTA